MRKNTLLHQKMGKRYEPKLLQRRIKWSKGHEKCSASLIVRDIQNKNSNETSFHTTEAGTHHKKQEQSVLIWMRCSFTSFTASENIDWFSTFGTQYGYSKISRN